MPIPFDKYDYYTWNDFNRSPYAQFSSNKEERLRAYKWGEEEDFRVLLLMLDRYADKLQKK